MSARTYLSIGDVLSLLRQEFPDVTISKIRFLESQGLVNPERTPSGYRKFYEHDVERLRWVLRQQREHFLPLKVIKGRLETQADEDATEGAGEPGVPGTQDEDIALDTEAVPALVGGGRGSEASGARRGPTLPGFESQGATLPASPAAGTVPGTAAGAARGTGAAGAAASGVGAGGAGGCAMVGAEGVCWASCPPI